MKARRCGHCGKEGHTHARCPEIAEYRESERHRPRVVAKQIGALLATFDIKQRAEIAIDGLQDSVARDFAVGCNEGRKAVALIREAAAQPLRLVK